MHPSGRSNLNLNQTGETQITFSSLLFSDSCLSRASRTNADWTIETILTNMFFKIACRLWMTKCRKRNKRTNVKRDTFVKCKYCRVFVHTHVSLMTARLWNMCLKIILSLAKIQFAPQWISRWVDYLFGSSDRRNCFGNNENLWKCIRMKCLKCFHWTLLESTFWNWDKKQNWALRKNTFENHKTCFPVFIKIVCIYCVFFFLLYCWYKPKIIQNS